MLIMAASRRLWSNFYAITKPFLLPDMIKGNLTYPCVTRRKYREIQGVKDGNVVKIRGVLHEDNNSNIAPRLITEDECPLRSRGIQITYEDVLILQQFITSTGDILSQEETGLCQREYFKVISCVKMAQRANMLPGSENQSDDNNLKLNRYLTRYPIGSRTAIKSRGLHYRKMYYKIGDARVCRDAPRVSNKGIIDSH